MRVPSLDVDDEVSELRRMECGETGASECGTRSVELGKATLCFVMLTQAVEIRYAQLK